MKKMLLLMAFVAMAFYFLLSSYFSDVQINEYDSMGAVQENEAMEKGWIPKVLPPSAYNIVETHDIDVNTAFGKFSYREEDEANFLAKLKELNETYESEDFLFKIDKEKNLVNFRNKSLNSERKN